MKFSFRSPAIDSVKIIKCGKIKELANIFLYLTGNKLHPLYIAPIFFWIFL